jgi:hypothetical protein
MTLNSFFAAAVINRGFFVIFIKWNIAMVDENMFSKDQRSHCSGYDKYSLLGQIAV